MKLLNKTYLQYSGKVYDIKVSTPDHSYIINKAVVHNSAAGSLCSWLIGLTKIDPIEYGLLFERFLNKGRIFKQIKVKKVKVNQDIELDFDERVSVFRDNNEITIRAHELQKGDQILDIQNHKIPGPTK